MEVALFKTGSNKKSPWRLLSAAAQLAAIALIYGSLVPFNFENPGPVLISRELKFVLDPFGSPRAYFDLVLNTILYLPLGLCWSLIDSGSKRTGFIPGFLKFFFSTALFSISLEALQLLLPSRICTTLDVIANVAGGCAGYVLGAALYRAAVGVYRQVVSAWERDPSLRAMLKRIVRYSGLGFEISARGVTVELLMCAYLGYLTTVFWNPFVFDFSSFRMAKSVDSFWGLPFYALQGGSYFGALLSVCSDLIPFIPLGALIALCASRKWSKAAARKELRAGSLFLFAVCVVFEAIQCALPNHTADISDVILYFAGGTLGINLTIIAQRQYRSAKILIARSSSYLNRAQVAASNSDPYLLSLPQLMARQAE